MTKLCTFLLFIFLQHVLSSHQIVPSTDPREYSNFELSRRRGQQAPQFDGWDWEEPSRPVRANDDFLFEDDFESRSNILRTTQRSTRRTTQRLPNFTVPVPGMATPRTPCEDRCLTTPEYNPVCGDDNMTYFSQSRLNCAQRCGKRVKIRHAGVCSRRLSRSLDQE